MKRIFAWRERVARSTWSREIEDLAGAAGRRFFWRKHTCFGGL
jgi:hypothetical protein